MKSNKVKVTLFFIILVTNLFCCNLALAISRGIILDPEIPWNNDPDLSTIQDEGILHLWDKVVKGYRRKNTNRGGAINLHLDEKYTNGKNSTVDQLYLLEAFEKELKKEHINWNCIFAIQIIMMSGMDANPKIPELADFLFKLERPHKMSQIHGLAYLTMLSILGFQQSNEAANLLCTAVNENYWGKSPMLSPYLSKNSTEKSICHLRQRAIINLSKIPISICAPYLNELIANYPIPSDYEDVFNHINNYDDARYSEYKSRWDNEYEFYHTLKSYVYNLKDELEEYNSNNVESKE